MPAPSRLTSRHHSRRNLETETGISFALGRRVPPCARHTAASDAGTGVGPRRVCSQFLTGSARVLSLVKTTIAPASRSSVISSRLSSRVAAWVFRVRLSWRSRTGLGRAVSCRASSSSESVSAETRTPGPGHWQGTWGWSGIYDETGAAQYVSFGEGVGVVAGRSVTKDAVRRSALRSTRASAQLERRTVPPGFVRSEAVRLFLAQRRTGKRPV